MSMEQAAVGLAWLAAAVLCGRRWVLQQGGCVWALAALGCMVVAWVALGGGR